MDSYSQSNPIVPSGSSFTNSYLFNSAQYVQTDSGIYVTYFTRIDCKNYLSNTKFYASPKVAVTLEREKEFKKIIQPVKSVKLFTIRGSIYYDFFYRSAIDTPISQKNFQQHTERINLELLVREKYPLRISFTARQSNSPYFRNFFDPNFQFDRFTYNKNLKQNLINRLNQQLPMNPDLKLAEAALQEEINRYSKLKKRVNNQTSLQKVIEEKEKGLGAKPPRVKEKNLNRQYNLDSLLAGKYGQTDTLKRLVANADSVKQRLNSFYLNEKAQLDSLSQKVNDLQRKTDSIRNNIQHRITAAKQKINKSTSQKELLSIASEYGIKSDNRESFQKHLAAVKSFSVGRSMVNYTELTAQNITITGLNIEYNPSYYAAIATGKIDYRFRDFYNRDSRKSQRNNQYLVLGRIGIGDKEKRALIFTLYQGRKNTAEFSLSDTVKNYVNLTGYSIEAIYKLDENTNLSAEFAKSTKPITGNMQSSKQTGVLWNYSDKTNMGINIKGQTIIPETNTRLSGFYRKTGENFQSFSLFSYNTNQTAWLARVDQEFYKKRITLTGMLRRNDFTNPFTDKTYKTSTVFKTVLLHVRFPKYPSLSLGYYPGTQLYLINKDVIRENAYYILNGSLVYNYFFKRTGMSTSIVYNRYTNQASDSGFVLYKGVNYYAAQSIFFKRLNLQGSYSYNKQPELEYFTLESGGDYSFKKLLRIGAGLKYNKVPGGSSYWGERLQLSADLKKFGQLQLQYEKSYLPTIKQTLYPVEIGRVSYYKYF